MIKSAVRWYFNRKAVRMHKSGVSMPDPLRRRKVKMKGTQMYRGGDGVYNYTRETKQAYVKFIFIFAVVACCLGWLGYQSYLGWDLFQP